MSSLVRQNYSAEVERGVNVQINNELQASYNYRAMACHFGRPDVSLPGVQLFFNKQADEEQQHAQKLIAYQNTRGGRVELVDVKKPTKQEWPTALDAFTQALQMELTNNHALLQLHAVASENQDPDVSHSHAFIDPRLQMTNFLEEFYLRTQVAEIEQMGRLVQQLRRLGTGLGEYLFDRDLLARVNAQS